MAILYTGEPRGALDQMALQSPIVDEQDPWAMARDRRQQQIIENQSEIDRLKGDKLGGLGRLLTAASMGYRGQDPSAAFADFNSRVGALQQQNSQLNAGIEDLTLQEAMQRQKMAQAGMGGVGTYNPRDYTTESWAAFINTGRRDPSVLVRHDPFTQDNVRWAPDGQGGYRPVVTEQQRMDAGAIDAELARLTKLKEEMGRGQGEAAVSDVVGDARADIIRKEKTAADAIEQSGKLFDQVATIRQGLPSYDDAIQAIDDGATTGRIAGLLPSFRDSTLRFENAANKLGLSVIAGTTFGALSEAELRMAMETAVPRGMQGPELKQWLMDKRAAEEKLARELERAAIYLEGGGTRAGLAQMMESPNNAKLSGDIQRDPVEQQADAQSTQTADPLGIR